MRVSDQLVNIGVVESFGPRGPAYTFRGGFRIGQQSHADDGCGGHFDVGDLSAGISKVPNGAFRGAELFRVDLRVFS